MHSKYVDATHKTVKKPDMLSIGNPEFCTWTTN